MVEHVDVVQNSPEWLEARRGLVTASNFAIVMREGKDGKAALTREDFLYRLAGEILSGEVAESFKSEAMKRGNLMEAEARERYILGTFENVRRVGFVKRTIASKIARVDPLVIGASPDALVGARGGLEIKTMAPHLLIRQIERAVAPGEHRPQVQGTMWVCDLDHVDLVFFYRGRLTGPKYRIERDETFIAQLRNEVEVFDHQLKKLVAKIRRTGAAS
ncbi:MAG: hypothetical protein A3E78_03245 [Alphaproteobacteria bacterium RIFCSPHIGHO2_12_FULL_63_12]|nr:MAG: hypothetical protein A3E78_03245 [Alphaproteobacteria bacterium RIFCSPHIGHO2_12_FULL_63_12]